MTMTPSHGPETPSTTLRELKLAFISARERGEPLDSWIGRYPQHARMLIDLAAALATTPEQPEPRPEEIALPSHAHGLRWRAQDPRPRALPSASAPPA